VDLAAWSGLTAGDTRTAVTLAGSSLASLNIAGTEHLLDPQTPDRLAAARVHAAGILLLPGFDEFLLGYRDRSAQLDPAYADRIVPGGNGIFRPTIVSAGRVEGTWTSTGRGARQEVTATPLHQLPCPRRERHRGAVRRPALSGARGRPASRSSSGTTSDRYALGSVALRSRVG